MICQNTTVGTRVDTSSQDIATLCSSFKQEISSRLADKLNAGHLTNLLRLKFTVPKARQQKHLLTASSTRQDKEKLSEHLLKVSENSTNIPTLDDSKKTKKIVEFLIQFEDLAFSQKLVDVEKLAEVRRLSRVLLSDAMKSEELFKFAHIETIVIAIAMTASSLAGLSPKRVFGVLEEIFWKKIKLAKLRKSRGYELMKSIGFRVWDVY